MEFLASMQAPKSGFHLNHQFATHTCTECQPMTAITASNRPAMYTKWLCNEHARTTRLGTLSRHYHRIEIGLLLGIVP